MSIKIGEIGKLLYIGAYFDLSNDAELEVEVKDPSGNTKILLGAVAPAVDSPVLPDVGVLPANTYGLYLTQADDFDVAGTWQARIIYTDLTPKLYKGDWADLVIED